MCGCYLFVVQLHKFTRGDDVMHDFPCVSLWMNAWIEGSLYGFEVIVIVATCWHLSCFQL